MSTSPTILSQGTTLSLVDFYHQVRGVSETLCAPLAIEDYIVQTMPDVSPPKWHLAHTTWFFETFLLVPNLPDYQVFHPTFGYLFNSYYESVGQRHPRPQRGVLSRPTVEEIYRYRAHVDQAMASLLQVPELKELILLGLHHEQQHQELLVTDIKHILATNPLRPAYLSRRGEWESERVGEQGCVGNENPVGEEHPPAVSQVPQERWLDYPGGLYTIGYAGTEFAFDNESPQHSIYLQDFWLASQLVTNGEYLEFIADNGYHKPEYWLSDGWHTVQTQQWQAPLYWEQMDGAWWVMTLAGLCPVDLAEPVCHVSFYEADAFARWVGKRLPTEAEWEVATTNVPIQGNFLESGRCHPAAATGTTRPDQLYGDVWEWTQSAYHSYPGYQPAKGAIGEYNGKFMCNQMILRGGSCATPHSHIRPTYRNFFPPSARWQFTGIRLGATV